MSNPRPRIPPPEAHRRGEAVDVVFETIRQGIISGRFAPGQRLVIRDLADDIPYSRSTFREALRRLAAERLVSLIPNRGAAVQRLTPQEMTDLFEIRELLEGQAARRAAGTLDCGQARAEPTADPAYPAIAASARPLP